MEGDTLNYQMEVENKIGEYPVRELIVANRLLKEDLTYIPESSYYKSLERMVKKGELQKVAKGVYCKPKITRFGIISSGEEDILNYYVGKENTKGIVVGYRLYNKYGITTQISKTIEIYSSMVDEERKNIRNINIKRIKLSINAEITKAIEQLEILQNYNEIEDANKDKFISFINNVVDGYSNKIFMNILSNMKYKKRTIAFLENILNHNNVSNTLSQFLNRTSKYRMPVMEVLYESSY